jgi:hypothetical protein
MDDMTQQNAALVEQTAAASASLQEQAQSLVLSMSVFELGDDGAGAGGGQAVMAPRVTGRPQRMAPPALRARDARAREGGY